MSIVVALETPVAGNPQSYAEYQSESDKYCESDERTWAKDRSLVGKIDYSEFDARAVNATLSKWRNNPDTSSEEKIRIKQ